MNINYGGAAPTLPQPYQPPPPQKPRKSGMPKWAIVLVSAAAGVAAIIGVSVAAAGSNPTTASAPKTTTTQPAAPASTPPAEPAAPDPKGTYTGSGDYILSPTLYGNSYLVGEVDMTNTGNIGLIVRVKFTWPQGGSPPIAAYKTIRVPYGQTRVARFHVSAGNVSNSTVIDQLQAWQTGHNYQDGYTWTAKITGTFGEAH